MAGELKSGFIDEPPNDLAFSKIGGGFLFIVQISKQNEQSVHLLRWVSMRRIS